MVHLCAHPTTDTTGTPNLQHGTAKDLGLCCHLRWHSCKMHKNEILRTPLRGICGRTELYFLQINKANGRWRLSIIYSASGTKKIIPISRDHNMQGFWRLYCCFIAAGKKRTRAFVCLQGTLHHVITWVPLHWRVGGTIGWVLADRVILFVFCFCCSCRPLFEDFWNANWENWQSNAELTQQNEPLSGGKE